MKTKDKYGNEVSIGTSIRVLSIRSILELPLCEEEKVKVQTMLGEVFEVYDVDDYGSAWVEKWWHHADSSSNSHSIALSPEEMEVYEK